MLACIHCRAEAIQKPLPGELGTAEAMELIDRIASFGSPGPILVITGGDPLIRVDLWDLISYASERRVRVSLAPSVTPLLNDTAIRKISEHGVSAISISIDSPYPEVHDSIRGISGTWARSVEILKKLLDSGIRVQVNTVIMRPTLKGLPDMVAFLDRLGVPVWEVFYLIRVGRAQASLDLEPHEWEDVSIFLYEASKYGITVRTVEGPMFRRVSIARRALELRGMDPDSVVRGGPLYRFLIERLRKAMGSSRSEPKAQTTGTRDGKGIMFIAYNGDIYPSGFLPIRVDNVRSNSL
jgi:MoaA/NifB/PqqE/SkfB family radical SAM enzyme